MTDPIVFISRHRVKEGLFEEFREHYLDTVPRVEAGKPGTLLQLAYADQDASEVAIVRLFTSAEAMDLHLRGADERSRAAYRFIEPVSMEIYGASNQYAMEIIKKVAGSGIDVSVNSQFIGGFIRPKPG